MRSPWNCWTFLAAAISGLLTVSLAPADDDENEFITQIVIELAEGFGPADIDDLVAEHPEIAAVEASIPEHSIYLLSLTDPIAESDFETIFEPLLEDDERIEDLDDNDETEPPGGQTQDFYIQVGESAYDTQYTWPLIDLSSAHELTQGEGIVVALLDAGLDTSHPALLGHIVAGGYNFVDQNEDVTELPAGAFSGHGTFIAGLVAKVAPQAGLLPIKVLDPNGLGHVFYVAQGIYHAIALDADVINLSLTVPEGNDILDLAIEDARAAGIVIVAAAGNLGEGAAVYPASSPDVVGVAATDADDVLTDFSCFGEGIALCAPGAGVVSSVPNGGFGVWDGTSQSAAIVSGVAALVRSANPVATPQDVEAALLAGVDAIDDPEGLLGSGRVNAALALGFDPGGPVTGDLNADGLVDVSDLVILIGQWGQSGAAADLDGDGIVGVGDLIVMITNWS